MEKLRALKRFKYDGRHLERGDEFEPREKDKKVLVAARLAEHPQGEHTIAPPPAQMQTRHLKAEETPPPAAPMRTNPRYLRRDMRPKE